MADVRNGTYLNPELLVQVIYPAARDKLRCTGHMSTHLRFQPRHKRCLQALYLSLQLPNGKNTYSRPSLIAPSPLVHCPRFRSQSAICKGKFPNLGVGWEIPSKLPSKLADGGCAISEGGLYSVKI